MRLMICAAAFLALAEPASARHLDLTPQDPASQEPIPAGAVQLICDPLVDATFWWDFHQVHFLELRRERPVEWPPTEEDIMDGILPALERALVTAEDRDVDLVVTAMIALAKIGRDHPDFRLLDVLRSRLGSGQQEIREAAALALGIAGPVQRCGGEPSGEEQLELLRGLALDDDLGREVSGGVAVRDRTRAFAAYGLGLLAHRTAKLADKRRAFTALQTLIEDDRLTSRDVRVAAIHGSSLLRLQGGSEGEEALLAAVLAALGGYYRRELGAEQHVVQAHVPTAIAKLIDRDHPRAAYYRELFARDLVGGDAATHDSVDITRSCALALARLCRPCRGDASPDARYCDLLLRAFDSAEDEVTRYFAILALGEIGGVRNRASLLGAFANAKPQAKGWCALGLGIYSFDVYRERERKGVAWQLETGIGEALYAAFCTTKNPGLLAALAIAIGLNRYAEAAPRMREMLPGKIAQEQLAGCLCTGLALLNDAAAIGDLRRLLAQLSRRADLFGHAAIALSRLGDRQLTATLVEQLRGTGANLAHRAVILSALGRRGDRAAIAPLIDVLADSERDQLSRAFAAEALGNLADMELLPWNAKIAIGTNYGAAVATLTNRSTGVLDLR